MLAERKMSVTALSEALDITMTNMFIFKTGKVKAVKLSRLNKICEVFDFQPGDLLAY